MKINFLKIAFPFFFISLLISCDSTEIKYEYFDANKKNLKTKAEYKNEKQNGLMAAYNEDGKLVEVSEWKDNQRDGPTISFYPNGGGYGTRL